MQVLDLWKNFIEKFSADCVRRRIGIEKGPFCVDQASRLACHARRRCTESGRGPSSMIWRKQTEGAHNSAGSPRVDNNDA